MKHRPLVINKAVQADVARVKAYAEANRMNLSEVIRRIGKKESVGDDPKRRIFIPLGFRVVYSIEQQQEPLGWCHHISVSVTDKGSWPNETAVSAICALFGVTFPSKYSFVNLEPQFEAVSIVSPISQDIPPQCPRCRKWDEVQRAPALNSVYECRRCQHQFCVQ